METVENIGKYSTIFYLYAHLIDFWWPPSREEKLGAGCLS
jgi:hypothetical protein